MPLQMLLRMRSTLKGNEHLAKGLIIGVFRIVKASLFSDLNDAAKKNPKTQSTTARGAVEFKELLEKSTIFIDKSFLIKDFLQSTARVSLITCPRRWGKSINMNMIKTFLEIQVNEKGEKHQEKKSTSNYRLFAQGIVVSGDRSDLLEKSLYISQCDNIMKEYQGEYPVISVDFIDVGGRGYEHILTKVKSAISKSFEQHKYMMYVLDRIENDEQSIYPEREYARNSLLKFKRICNNDAEEATQSHIEESLQFLSQLLHNHFKKKVFVLIDEYDSPINNILLDDQFYSEDIGKTLYLFESLMKNTFKSNKHLEKGLITGVYRVGKASVFSSLNNVIEYNFLSNAFARYYGFSQDEVTSLFKEYNISPELSQQAKDWYNGYRVLKDPDLQIYNPWSIVNFLANKEIMNYWEESGNIDFIKELFKVDDIKTKIFALINKEDVQINLQDLKFSKKDLLTLKKFVNPNTNVSLTTESVNLFFCFIFASGYLTLDVDKARKPSSSTSSYIRLPNLEITTELSYKLKDYYEKLYNIPQGLMDDATKALEELFKSGAYKKFQQVLENIFSGFQFTKITNSEQSGIHPNEDAFHSIVNVIAMQSSCKKFGSEISYNTGIKRGRADIVLVDDHIQLGMIIEIKYNSTAQEGLEQAKQYAPIFDRFNNLKQIRYIGLNISTKRKVNIATYLEDRQDL